MTSATSIAYGFTLVVAVSIVGCVTKVRGSCHKPPDQPSQSTSVLSRCVYNVISHMNEVYRFGLVDQFVGYGTLIDHVFYVKFDLHGYHNSYPNIVKMRQGSFTAVFIAGRRQPNEES